MKHYGIKHIFQIKMITSGHRSALYCSLEFFKEILLFYQEIEGDAHHESQGAKVSKTVEKFYLKDWHFYTIYLL